MKTSIAKRDVSSYATQRLPAWNALFALLLLFSSAALSAQNPAAQAAEADKLFRSGSAAFAAGDIQEAHRAFARLVKLLPRAGVAHSAYGAVLLAEGEPKLAVAELRLALQLDPKDLRAALNLGVALRSLGDNAGTVNAFRNAGNVVLQPKEALAYGGALAATGDLAGAQSVLEAALPDASDPRQNAQILDTLGAVLAQASRLPEALQRFQQALAADPSLASAHAHLGSALLFSGDSVGALRELQTAEQSGDRSTTTLVQLARAELANGHDHDAEAIARRALAASPNDTEAKYALALALQNGGDSAGALPLFKAVAAERPNDAEILANCGLALVQTGHAKEALALYEQALAKGGAVPTLRENMGAAYIQQNDIDHAIEQFLLGLAVETDNVQLRYNLGLAYKLKDNTEAATRELKRAEELEPNLPDPPYTLGILEMQQGHFDQAASQLERVVALQPGNGDAWSLLGSVYQQSHDLDKAASALRRAITLLPAQPSPHVTLAAVLSESGDRPGAAAERKIAAELSRTAVSHQRAQFAIDSGRKLLKQGKIEDALTQARTAVDAEPDSAVAHSLLADALQRAGRADEAQTERKKASAIQPSAPGK